MENRVGINKNTELLLSLYVLGLDRINNYQETDLIDKEDTYVKHFTRNGNNWGQGDLKVTIEKSSGIVTVEEREIDGDNWGISWYEILPKLTISIDELVEQTKPLLLAYKHLKEIENNYKQEIDLLKQKIQDVEKEKSYLNFSLEHEKEFRKIIRDTTKDFYYIPLLSEIKNSIYMRKLIKKTSKNEMTR